MNFLKKSLMEMYVNKSVRKQKYKKYCIWIIEKLYFFLKVIEIGSSYLDLYAVESYIYSYDMPSVITLSLSMTSRSFELQIILKPG